MPPAYATRLIYLWLLFGTVVDLLSTQAPVIIDRTYHFFLFPGDFVPYIMILQVSWSPIQRDFILDIPWICF